MEYQYTIEDLASKAGVSKQSIYNLLSKDKEFINNNSRKQQRKIKYSQAVLDMILEYYGKSSQAAEQPQETAEAAQAADPTEPEKPGEEIEALRAQIEALKQEIAEKDELLAKKEQERQELLKQNGLTLLLLQQEKQEKQLLLPAPKKSFWKRLFGKSESLQE